MAITNFVITANGAGYAESDGLNPIASTEAKANIINGIVEIVLSGGGSWKNTPLEFCTLNGVALSVDPRVAIDQLAQAGFRTPSGGSGGGVESFNGQTGIVEYPLFKKSDGTTNADSYSEKIRHNGDIVLSGNSNNILTRMLKYDQGDFGAVIDDFGLFEARRDGDTVNGLEWGSIYAGLSPNDQKPALTLLTQQLNETAKTVGTLVNIVNNTEELFKIVAGGQVTFNNYGNGTFTGVATKLLGSDVDGNIIEIDPVSSSDFEQSEGQVKINTGNGIKPTATGFSSNVANILSYASPLGLSNAPTTQFPLSQNGLDSDIIDFSTGNFLEVPIDGLVNTWRINYTFSNKAANSNAGLTIGLFNPNTTFETSVSLTLPSNTTQSPIVDLGGGDIRQVEQSIKLTTIADSSSIGSGYKLFASLTSSDNNLTVVIESVTRLTGVKEVRI